MNLKQMRMGGRHCPASFPIGKLAVLCSLLYVIFIVSACPFAAAEEPRQYVKLPYEACEDMLSFFSSQQRSNFQRIETWQGAYTYDDVHNYLGYRAAKNASVYGIDDPDSIQAIAKHVSGSGKFALRPRTNELFTTHIADSTDIQVQRKSGAQQEIESLNYMQRSVVTPEHYLHFQPNVRYAASSTPQAGDVNGRCAFRDSVAKSERQEWGILVDPCKFFGDGAPYYKTMEAFAETVRKGIRIPGREDLDPIQVFHESVGESGRYKVLYTAPMGQSIITTEMVIDPAAGFNVTQVSYVLEGGVVQQEWQIAYEEKDGVFLPNRIERVIFDIETGTERFKRTVTLTESSLNEVLPDKTFTWESLGLAEGDRFIDNLENKEYIVRNGRLEEATSTNPELEQAVNIEELAEELPQPVVTEQATAEADAPEAETQEPATVSDDTGQGSSIWKVTFFFALACLAILAVLALLKYRRTRSESAGNSG